MDKLPLNVTATFKRDKEARLSYQNLFRAISESLFKNDPMGISYESNTDEYEAEAETIIPRLKSCVTEDDVLSVVHDEFTRWFGNCAGPRSHYRKTASDIWQMWQETCGGTDPDGETMSKPCKIIAILGTYRKGGIIDTAVEELLASAREAGAETNKVYLIDRHIEFCTNCRSCTQEEGLSRGVCPLADDMREILDEIERSDAIVLASPMNFWTVTAVMKRFIERLVCFAYWPWGEHAPKIRDVKKTKRAVIVVSSAAPSLLARLMTRMVGLLKSCAGLLGAKTVGVLFIGLAAQQSKQDIGERAKRKARRLGKKLVS